MGAGLPRGLSFAHGLRANSIWLLRRRWHVGCGTLPTTGSRRRLWHRILPDGHNQMDLVRRVARELNVSHRQAEGAVGAVLSLAHHRLSGAVLEQVADCIPGFSAIAAKSPRFDATRLTWRGRVRKLLGGAGGCWVLDEPLTRLSIARTAAPWLISAVVAEVRRQGGPAVESALRSVLS